MYCSKWKGYDVIVTVKIQTMINKTKNLLYSKQNMDWTKKLCIPGRYIFQWGCSAVKLILEPFLGTGP